MDLVTNVLDVYVCCSWAKEALQNCCLPCRYKLKQGLINEKEVYCGISCANDYFKYINGNNEL